MPTDMVTFVQATYALMTFVQISNISAVGPNFWGSRFLWTKMFLDKTSTDPNSFLTQIFFPDLKSYLGPKFLDQRYYWTQTKFRTKILIGPKIFSDLNWFQTQNYFGPKSLKKKKFQVKIFFGPTISFK